MDKTLEFIEKLTILIATTPEFKIPLRSEADIPKYNTFYVLKGRDEQGCRTVLHDYSKVKLENFTLSDAITNMILLYRVLVMDEKTQICGIKIISDMREFTAQHAKCLLSSNGLKLLPFMKYSGVRIKKTTVIGLNDFVRNIYENTVKCMLSDKLVNRVEFVKKPESEIADEDIEDLRWKCIEIEKRCPWRDVKMDLDVLRKYEGYESVGSFRTLEID